MKLEIGYTDSFEVRFENYHMQNAYGITILFLSDLHFNRFSAGITKKIIEKIIELNPDVILFGGDYVDSDAGLFHFDNLLKSLSSRKNVFAISGNHDAFFGIERLMTVIHANNIQWIEKQSRLISVKNINLQIDGNMMFPKQKEAGAAILCIHKPIDLHPVYKMYDLVFSGHLHGCQFIFWKNKKGLYPGRFFYSRNFLMQRVHASINLVSKGMGDTLPLRFNCPKDMIFVTLDKPVNIT